MVKASTTILFALVAILNLLPADLKEFDSAVMGVNKLDQFGTVFAFFLMLALLVFQLVAGNLNLRRSTLIQRFAFGALVGIWVFFTIRSNPLGVNTLLSLSILLLATALVSAPQWRLQAPKLPHFLPPALLIAVSGSQWLYWHFSGINYTSSPDTALIQTLPLLAALCLYVPNNADLNLPNLALRLAGLWTAYVFALISGVRSGSVLLGLTVVIFSLWLTKLWASRILLLLASAFFATFTWSELSFRPVIVSGTLLDSGRFEDYYSLLLQEHNLLPTQGVGSARSLILETSMGTVSNPHSSWIAMVFDYGWFGTVLLLLATVCSLAWISLRNQRFENKLAMTLGILFFSALGLFNMALEEPQVLVTFLLVILLGGALQKASAKHDQHESEMRESE